MNPLPLCFAFFLLATVAAVLPGRTKMDKARRYTGLVAMVCEVAVIAWALEWN